MILKGTQIDSGSILAAMSVASKKKLNTIRFTPGIRVRESANLVFGTNPVSIPGNSHKQMPACK